MDRLHSTAKAPTLIALNLLVLIAYALTGFVGLKLAFVGQMVTLFWPPSGIAFAAVWLGGLRLLPGVFLGAVLVNLFAFRSPELALIVGFGNMLPALASVAVLQRLLRRHASPSDLQSVLGFIVVAVLGSTLLSASVGALAVAASGLPERHSLVSTFTVWWLGDAMGVLLAAPPVLLARRWGDHRWTLSLALEATAFLLAWGATITALIFVREPGWAPELCKLFTLLLSLWAGARFGLHGATTMTLLMAVGAGAATAAGAGPFVRGDFHETFALLHSYLFAQAVAAMLLAGALADLRRTVVAERAARGAAETAASSQFRLLTTISHDVRTPLNGIMGVFQTLEEARLRPRERRLVELGLRAGGTLTALVSDILESARLESGRLRIQPGPFDPARSLDDLVQLNRNSAIDKGVVLTLSGEGDLPPRLTGDRVRFEQVLGNLLTNAIAHTASGEVRIGAHWIADAPHPLLVEVVDTGSGIDPGLAPQIFDAFVQGREARQVGRAAGLGLGLDICRRLTHALGGRLAYSPREGGGSVFRLELPFPIAGDALPLAPAPEAEAPLAILLVDDDDIGREVTAALLEARGHRVRAVGDEDAAVAAAAQQRFELVLMDINLSSGGIERGSGLEAARRIRALPGIPAGLRILALTADAFDDRERFREAGLDGSLIKPLGVEVDLRSALETGRLPQ